MKHRFSSDKRSSGDIAKDRLRQMKTAERTDCSVEDLEQMKSELSAVMIKYIDIGKKDIHLYLRHGKHTDILVAAVSLPSVGKDDVAEILRRSS